MWHKGDEIMNYRFEKLFIGTLAENNGGDIIYRGEILCTQHENDIVMDLINGKEYEHLDFNDRYKAGIDQIYVSRLYEQNINGHSNNIFSRTSLLRVASELNAKWTNIAIPQKEAYLFLCHHLNSNMTIGEDFKEETQVKTKRNK